jgi:hypothetical protein
MRGPREPLDGHRLPIFEPRTTRVPDRHALREVQSLIHGQDRRHRHALPAHDLPKVWARRFVGASARIHEGYDLARSHADASRLALTRATVSVR